MQDTFYRDTSIGIDLKAIEYNIMEVNKQLPKSTEIMAVVKANAYGHGSIQVAKKALQSGATSLGVAFLEEALELRRAGITSPILVLGIVAPRYASIAADYKITLTFFQLGWLKEVNEISLDSTLRVHMKWDTGMGRIGLRSETELTEVIKELTNNSNIELTGVFTHFSTADSEDLSYFNLQKESFNNLLSKFKKQWQSPVQIHIGNSAAAIRFPEEMYNTIRLGISMYGLYPSDVTKKENRIHLKQAFSLCSKLIHVKKVAPGESIGYGQEYVTSKDEWIGTIPIGYGDGWARRLQGFDVLINGKKFLIVGRICMDQMMVRLDKSYPVGTEVVLIGQQNNQLISVDDVADYLGTINYEIPCMLNDRIPHVYYGK